MLLENKRSPIKDMYTKLNIMTLQERREFHLTMDTFTHIIRIVACTTTLELNLLTRHRRAYLYRVPYTWNNDPNNMREIVGRNEFKRESYKLIMRFENDPGEIRVVTA